VFLHYIYSRSRNYFYTQGNRRGVFAWVFLQGYPTPTSVSCRSLSRGVNIFFDSTILGGVTVIRGAGSVLNDTEWEDNLYITGPSAKQIDVTAIPYYAWCNRGTGKMAVWVL